MKTDDSSAKPYAWANDDRVNTLVVVGVLTMILGPIGLFMVRDTAESRELQSYGVRVDTTVIGVFKTSPSMTSYSGSQYAQVVYTTRDGEEMEAVVGITEEMADEITEHPLQHFGLDIPIVYLEDSPEDARHADNVQIDPLWHRTGQVFFFGSLVGVLVWVTVFLRMRAD